MTRASWFFRAVVFCFAICGVSATALATSIPFTGILTDSAGIIEYSLSGASLQIGHSPASHAPGGSVSPPDGTVVISLGLYNSRCCSGEIDTAMFNGIAFNSFGGSLTFSFPAGFPTAPVALGSNISVPIDVSGEATLWGGPNGSGNPMVNVLFSGSGALSEIDLTTCGAPNLTSCSPSSPDAQFLKLEYDFSGTATPSTPEPASLILMGTGMIGLGVIALKRRACTA